MERKATWVQVERKKERRIPDTKCALNLMVVIGFWLCRIAMGIWNLAKITIVEVSNVHNYQSLSLSSSCCGHGGLSFPCAGEFPKRRSDMKRIIINLV